jgi:uncharacterized protein YjbI with pentapeptide repeats
MINCDLEEVVFNNAPVANSQIRGVNSVAMVVINSPFTHNIMFNNKGLERVVTNAPITNISELVANKNLSNMNMAYLDLSKINTQQVTFKGTILRGVNFTEAVLKSCLFVDADLRYTDLTKADLRGSEIRNSKFNGAKLVGTNLSSTNLSNLNFTRALTIDLILDKAQIINEVGMDSNMSKKKAAD